MPPTCSTARAPHRRRNRADFDQPLHVAGFLAFRQSFLRERDQYTACLRSAVSLSASRFIRHGQHAAGFRVLSDCGNQTFAVPRNFIEPGHKRTSMPRERMCSFAGAR